MWALVKDNKVLEVIERPRMFVDINGYTRFKSVFDLWPNSDLKQIGVYPLEIVDTSPSKFHKFSGFTYTIGEDKVTKTVEYQEIALEDAKKLAQNMLNVWKQRKQDGTFEWYGFNWQCDPRSRGFITGRALEAFMTLSLGQQFEVNFRDADNTDHTFDAQQMIDLGKAAAEHVQYWHDEAKSIKGLVANAASVSAIIDLLPEDISSSNAW